MRIIEDAFDESPLGMSRLAEQEVAAIPEEDALRQKDRRVPQADEPRRRILRMANVVHQPNPTHDAPKVVAQLDAVRRAVAGKDAEA